MVYSLSLMVGKWVQKTTNHKLLTMNDKPSVILFPSMSSVFHTLLANVARKQLAVHTPHVIAVTGSVGKTSTRTAIAHALSVRFRVRTAQKNYNNEIGVPLAILGETSPGANAWEWAKLLVRNMGKEEMPEYLVLEYGADKPGDIAYLQTIAQPEVAVITAVSPVHVGNYPHYEALIEEKASLGDQINEKGLVVLNMDNEHTRAMKNRYRAQVITYGIHYEADVYAKDVAFFTRKDGDGRYMPGEEFARMTATIVAGSESADIVLVNCISETVLSAVLAACAVARFYGVPLTDAVRSLAKQTAPVHGRLNPISGIRGSLIIDDTYNAAPASMRAALDVLTAFTPGETHDRHIAVLGDMAELGTMTENEHRIIGRRVAEVADLFLAVGPNMRIAADEAIVAGMDHNRVEWFKDSVEAGRYLDQHVQGGDIVLIKGSQSMRMEKAVKDVMAEPLKASELLVRQESRWMKM